MKRIVEGDTIRLKKGAHGPPCGCRRMLVVIREDDDLYVQCECGTSAGGLPVKDAVLVRSIPRDKKTFVAAGEYKKQLNAILKKRHT